MPMETRHRLTGMLLQSPRGYLLRMDDGGTWALDLDRPAKRMLGQRVTIEGARSGFDRINVDWIGIATA
jgi:hypothetical protein